MTMRLGVLALALAAALTGCGGDGSVGDGGDGNEEETRAAVEQMIRSQLPDSVKRNTGEAVYVSRVTCAKEDDEGRKWDCVATVGGAGEAGLEYVDIGVTATCDEAVCTWKTE